MGFEQMWLNVQKDKPGAQCFKRIVYPEGSRIMENAARELQAAIAQMTGKKPVLCLDLNQDEGAEVISLSLRPGFHPEGYKISGNGETVAVEASDENGILYGCFELIRQLSLGTQTQELSIEKSPAIPLRMLNHWDNMDGSIERGYSGNSFFFEKNEILVDDRIRTYARLLASVGINGTVINNVNVKDAATDLITDRYFEKLRILSEILAEYGIKLFLSLNYAAPMEISGLPGADPLDEQVIRWWKERMQQVYAAVPGLGGFLIKADSEGRPGPFT